MSLIVLSNLIVNKYFQETRPYSPLRCWKLSKKGDGHCDDRNNYPECEHDDNDCCNDQQHWYCRTCECKDPEHPNYGRNARGLYSNMSLFD